MNTEKKKRKKDVMDIPQWLFSMSVIAKTKGEQGIMDAYRAWRKFL